METFIDKKLDKKYNKSHKKYFFRVKLLQLAYSKPLFINFSAQKSFVIQTFFTSSAFVNLRINSFKTKQKLVFLNFQSYVFLDCISWRPCVYDKGPSFPVYYFSRERERENKCITKVPKILCSFLNLFEDYGKT